jgi:hypothetical protein
MNTETKAITFGLLLIVTLALCAGSLFAIPLSVLVTKESEKIADSIRVFNKECAGRGDTATEQQGKECYEKHAAIAEALAKFVILAHEELDFLPEDPAKYRAEQQAQHPELQFDTSPEGDRQTILRRKDMQLQIRWAQHWINCLGREDASECKQERAALDKETYPFGRVGLMTPYPTHVGEEEAKHWYPMKIIPASPIASASPAGPRLPEKTAPESLNEEIQTFIQAFVRDMASNDATLQMRYYNNPCRYYDQGNTSLPTVRKDIERDITAWKKRAYSLHTQPVIRKTETLEYKVTFEMAYTLEDPKPRSSGILAMSLRLKPDNETFLITEIQKKVILARKR